MRLRLPAALLQRRGTLTPATGISAETLLEPRPLCAGDEYDRCREQGEIQPAHGLSLPARCALGVERLELAAKVREVRLGVEPSAGRPLEQLGRLEAPAPAMDVLAEPLAQLAELARLELRVEVSELRGRALPELDRDDVPERVRREVAKARARPVDVLEDALDDVFRLDAEVLLELGVERLRQLGGRDRPREHLPLELEAEDDVERVRHLVGLDARRARRDLVERAVELLERDAGKPRRERLLQARIEVPPRRETAPDDVLPQPALRFVE